MSQPSENNISAGRMAYDTDEPSVSRSRTGTLSRRLTTLSSNFGQTKPANANSELWNSGPGHSRRNSLSSFAPNTPSNTSTLSRDTAPRQSTSYITTAPVKDESQTMSSEEAKEIEKLIQHEKSLDWDQKVKMQATELNVRNEILSTEKLYVSQLVTLRNAYAKSFDDATVCENIGIDASQKTALVSNIELLANFHIQFLADLERDGIRLVEDNFIKYSAFFRMYSTYLANYQKCIDTIQSFRSNVLFQEHMNRIIAQLAEAGEHGDLMSFMIRPVQRVPRYVLLLRELRRQTLPSSEAFSKISNALAKISDTAMHINDAKRQIENTHTLVVLDKRVGGALGKFELIQSYRRLIYESEVVFLQDKTTFFNTIKASSRILFLFSDILLWTNKNMVYKDYVYLSSVRLCSIDDLHFEIRNSKIHITVQCPTSEVKDYFVSTIAKLHAEQTSARLKKIAIKRQGQGSMRQTTHTRIVDSLHELNRNTLSRRDGEAIRLQLAQNEDSLNRSFSSISLADDNQESSVKSISSTSTSLSTSTSSAPPQFSPSPPPGPPPGSVAPGPTPPSSSPTEVAPTPPVGVYRTRQVQSRGLRSGRTTIGADILKQSEGGN